jgi:hypothetical protein
MTGITSYLSNTLYCTNWTGSFYMGNVQCTFTPTFSASTDTYTVSVLMHCETQNVAYYLNTTTSSYVTTSGSFSASTVSGYVAGCFQRGYNNQTTQSLNMSQISLNSGLQICGTNSYYNTYSNWTTTGSFITNSITSSSGFNNVAATCFINNSGSNNDSCWNFYSMGTTQTTAVSFNTIYNGGFAHTSDSTTKQNIKTLNTSKSLTKILKMRPVNYQYIGADDYQRIGLISQEVAEITPLATVELPHSFTEKTDENGNTVLDDDGNPILEHIYKLALNYNDIFIHNVGATQEIYKLIETLQQQVVSLTQRVIELESKT